MEEKLYSMFNNVNDWLKFAEAKNFGLLTFNSAVFFGLTQVSYEDHHILQCVLYYIFSPFLIVSTFIGLISFMPILTAIEKGSWVKSWIQWLSNIIDSEKPFENIHFFGYLRTLNNTEFERKLNEKLGLNHQFNEFESELATQILYNSRITGLKYQLFKISGFITLSGILVSAIVLGIKSI